MTNTQPSDSANEETNSTLTDFNYEQHKLETPDSYVRQPAEGEDIYNLSACDRIWIDGTEYTVISSGVDIISPPLKRVVGEDGSQHHLIAGEVPDKNVAGVTWESRVSDKKPKEMTRNVLVAEYDEVYITYEGESMESIHKVTPDTPKRECPECDNTHGGRPQHIEIQNNQAIEIRRCTNTDCKHIYRYTQSIDNTSSAEVLFRDHRDTESFSIEEITGFYEVENKDDYKHPVDTNDGIHDGYRTAAEIGEDLNARMVTPEITDLLAQPEFTPTALLDLLSFSIETEQPDWGDILVDHYKNVDTLIDFGAVRKVSLNLSADTPEEFIATLYTFYNVTHTGPKEPPEAHEWDQEDIIEVDRLANIIINLINDNEVTPQTPAEQETVDIFNQDLSGRDFLTSTPFYRLLTQTANESPVGKAEYTTKRYNSTLQSNPEIRWVDKINRHEQILEKNYGECITGKENTSFGMPRMWGADEYDMTQFMASFRGAKST